LEADVRIEKVDAVQTRGGNTCYVVRDDQGREYTTFRPTIGREAAPWVLGSNEPDREVPPGERFEKLEPFKRLVAEDIRHGGEADDG
jgi:hypothetical protein